jgi:DNA-binding transcriptional LysR family regulator
LEWNQFHNIPFEIWNGENMMNRQLDLDYLMLFHDVVEAGSLTAASAKLKLAKSTVSRRLARLEQQVGSILVKRGTRKLALTEIGASLHSRCQRIAAEVQQASEQALGMHSNMQGMIRLSIPGDLGVIWLGSVISDFVRQFPEINMAVRINNSDMVDPIEEPFDLVIQVGETKPLRSVYRRLATLSRGIYASPEYLARRGTPRSLEECKAHEWIVTDVQVRDGVWLFRKGLKRRAISVASRIVVNSARLARELAIAGLGLALVPDTLCSDAVIQRRLVRVLTDWRTPALQVVALFLSRDRIPRKTRVFLEFLAERMSESTRSEVTPTRTVGSRAN